MSRLIFNMAAKCDKAGRSENQDNYWVCPDLTHWDAPTGKTVGNDEDIELSHKGSLLVVADGMGGMNAGEKASELVIDGVKKRFSNIPDSILSNEEEIRKFIKDTITEADQSVKDYAKANRSAEGLGSTIVLLWILEERAYCGWCGDSRIYRYNPNNELVRLSHDHSYVQGLVDEGKINEEDAFDHPDGNIITRSLGDNGDVANPEITVYDVCERDVFLLCSDGLCGLLQDKEIEEIISKNCSSTKDALEALWEAGTKVGWSDNATIDLLYVISGGKHPKGVAVGYPKKQNSNIQKATSGLKGKSDKSLTNSVSTSLKLSRPPYLYIILAVALVVLSFALYKTCSSRENGEQENFNFTFGTGDSIQSQIDGNNNHNIATDDNNVNNNVGAIQGRHNSTSNGANQQINNNNGGSNRNNNNNTNDPAKVDNSNNNGANNANNIISSINNHSNTPSSEIQTEPDEDYMKQFKAVKNDVKFVLTALNNAYKYQGHVTEKEYNKMINFSKNVSHLAEKNNPSYKCLDKKSKNEIDNWLKIVDKINEIINDLDVYHK